MNTTTLYSHAIAEVPLHSDNVLLRRMPPDVLHSILRYGRHLRLTKDVMLCQAGRPISAVYFPENAIISQDRPFANGQSVQIATIGREGIVGFECALGVATSTLTSSCHTNGSTLRIAAEDFQLLFSKHIELQQACLQYSQGLINQLSVARACSLEHSIEQRSALWLLITSLRGESDHFFLTQDSLAEMLGISRTRVSIATSKLARRELIKFSRGQITILDRNNLEKTSCECLDTLAGMFAPGQPEFRTPKNVFESPTLLQQSH